jgi:transmembrane sensor
MDEKLQEISEEAFVWALLLESASPEEVGEFMSWVRASPSHMHDLLRAIAKIDRVHQQLASSNERSLPERTVRLTACDPSLRRSSARMSWQSVSTYLAAACCAVAIVGVVVFALSFRSVEKLNTAYEWKTQSLSDGTVVQLGPRTELVVEYSRSTRSIRLIHGEAMFEVAKNPNRPFIVSTESATARAVGTRFAMSAESAEQSVITVDEGVVAVKRSGDASGDDLRVTLRAGDEVRVTPGRDLSVHPVDLDAALAWTRHRLVFHHKSIAEAVHEFNRYNSTQIVMRDPAQTRGTVDGNFHADEPESFARFLEDQGVASIVRQDATTLLLVPYEGMPRRGAQK